MGSLGRGQAACHSCSRLHGAALGAGRVWAKPDRLGRAPIPGADPARIQPGKLLCVGVRQHAPPVAAVLAAAARRVGSDLQRAELSVQAHECLRIHG